jgi:hypothetical protein
MIRKNFVTEERIAARENDMCNTKLASRSGRALNVTPDITDAPFSHVVITSMNSRRRESTKMKSSRSSRVNDLALVSMGAFDNDYEQDYEQDESIALQNPNDDETINTERTQASNCSSIMVDSLSNITKIPFTPRGIDKNTSLNNRSSHSSNHSTRSNPRSPRTQKPSLGPSSSKELINRSPRGPLSPVEDTRDLIRVRRLRESPSPPPASARAVGKDKRASMYGNMYSFNQSMSTLELEGSRSEDGFLSHAEKQNLLMANYNNMSDLNCEETALAFPDTSALDEVPPTARTPSPRDLMPKDSPSPTCVSDTPLLVFRLSEKLLELEAKRIEKMTSRKLMEISEKLGIPIAYSTGRGMELVTENEDEFNAAIKMLEC